VRVQWSAAQRDAVILQTARLDAQRHRGVRTWFEQEPGSGGKEQAAQQVKMLAGYSAYAERVTGDKVTRAMPLAAQAEAAGEGSVERCVPRRDYQFPQWEIQGSDRRRERRV
jgi:phage terminase large subunit-like protein